MEEKTRFGEVKHESALLVEVIISAIIMGTNTKIFAKAAGLYPGGATGLSVLIQQLFEKFGGITIPYTPVNIILNAIPVFIGFRFIGKKFTTRSLIMILVCSVATDISPLHPISDDILLLSIFGGLINGFAISLALRADATSGGTDFIAIFLSERRGVDTFNLILGFNVIVLITAGYFFGFDKALYSIIFQYCSTQMLHLMYRNYMKQTLLIVTDKSSEICKAIYRISHHGATILNSEGSYLHVEREMVYSVISRAETKKVIEVIKEIDPTAFVNALPTTDLNGRFYNRPYN
ncbi:MAG: YitT family protein [Lachnospiraceae bacterium]|nr:YitT family protein [Lachnospiraceae bacterium]